MDGKKQNNVKVQIVFSTLIFTIAFFVEIYAMINYSQTYVLICGIAIVALLALYFLINGIIELTMLKNLRREEQYDSLFRSEKATYLMTKKRFEEIEQEIKRIERVAVIPVEEIVSAQKGIAKVIISRSRENAEAIMSSNDLIVDKMDNFNGRLDANNKQLLDEEKSFSSENFQQMLDKQQEIILNLKDMERRLNTSIMQSQKMIAEQKAMIHQPQFIQQPYPSSVPVQQSVQVPDNEIASNGEIQLKNESLLEESELLGSVMDEPVLEESELMDSLTEEPVLEESELSDSVMDEPILEESELSDSVIEEPVLEESELMDSLTEEPVEELTDDSLSLEESPVPEGETPMPDLSDPNRAMSPEEIAALLANMTEDVDKAEPASEDQPLMETLESDVIEETPLMETLESDAIEETPLMETLESDVIEETPLMETLESDAIEETPLMEILDDSIGEEQESRTEEILETSAEESFLDSMTEDILPEQILDEVSGQINDDVDVTEQKMDMPDLSDPNKKLSADEIAALFANMS